MHRKTSPRPIERASAVRPLFAETIARSSRLPTAAALAAALFAVGATSLGCSTKHADASSIGADDHDRGRVLASNEAVAHVGDGDKKPTGPGVASDDVAPIPTTIATVATTAPTPMPIPTPVPHGGKIAPIAPHPFPPPHPAGGPVAAPPKMPGGKSAVTTTIGATTTPPCPNQALDPSF